ncbi:S49 family peptidase, partial [bacterium AH-315-J21]|nr:S49 family peptidase [bacterium AH-315-J21]
RVLFPEGVHFHRFVASVSGAESIWTNPAALGANKSTATMLMFDYTNPNSGVSQYAKDWGLATSLGGFGYTRRKLANFSGSQDYKEQIFGYGQDTDGKFKFGLSYRYVSEGPLEFNKRHAWNLGALYRSGPHWSLGATWSNLNKSKVAGIKSAVEQVYGLAIRPMKDGRLTLDAEIALSHKQNFSEGVIRLGATGSPTRGLDLYGSWNENDNYEFGVRVNLEHSFIGGHSRHSSDDNFRSATTYFGTVSERQESILKQKRLLHVGLSGSIYENPLQTVFGRQKLTFYDYIASFYRAADDESIENVLVTVGANSLSWAQTQEIRQAFEVLRANGKQVFVYLNSASNRSYYLACAADKIIIPPASYLGLTGLRVELSFYAKTLEKIGVTIEAEKIGAYKTATEQWMASEPSEPNREMTNRWLGDLHQQLVAGIAKGRDFSQEKVQQIIDDGPYTSTEAEKLGLIDLLAYPDEIPKKIKTLSSRSVGLREYVREGELSDSWGTRPTIAVVVAEGLITSSPAGGDPTVKKGITPGGMGRGFAQALANPNVQGLTLRVNSPGGSALASDLIYRQSQLAKDALPLTVSMSGVAASGGYYISAAAKTVFADPATITGSIGIFALKPDLSGLYDKIGVNKVYIKKGENADFYSIARPFKEQERLKVRSGLRELYQRFIEIAGEERGLSADSVDALGEGRVWTGREALANGLVDSLGGLWESVRSTAEQAGLKDYQVEIYPKRKTLFSFGGNPLLAPLRALRRLVAFIPGVGESDFELDQATESALNELLTAGAQSFDTENYFATQHFSETQYLMRLPYDISVE